MEAVKDTASNDKRHDRTSRNAFRTRWTHNDYNIRKVTAIPVWFCVHRVRCALELATQAQSLNIVDAGHTTTQYIEEVLLLQQQLDEDEFGVVSQSAEVQIGSLCNDLSKTYHLDESAYRPIEMIFNNHGSEALGTNPSSKSRCFATSVVLLNSEEDCRPQERLPFLDAVIAYFTNESGADLVTLDVEDIKDILQHVHSWDTRWTHSNTDEDNPSRQNPDLLPLDKFPFAQLLSLPGVSRDSLRDNTAPPLVLHLPEISGIIEVFGLEFLRKLGVVLKKKLRYRPIIVFMSTTRTSKLPIEDFARSDCDCRSCKGTLPHQIVTDRGKAILHSHKRDRPYSDYDTHKPAELLKAMDPASPGLSILLPQPESNEHNGIRKQSSAEQDTWLEYNVRGLKRRLRHRSNKLHRRNILQPYVEWQFMDDTKLKKNWTDSPQDHTRLDSKIDSEVTDFELVEVILGKQSQRSKADDSTRTQGTTSGATSTGGRTKGEIESRFRWTLSSKEKGFLECAFYPGNSKEGWDEISVDRHTKDIMMRILALNAQCTVPDYGLMKDNGNRGALLYGPPGTGKTHLARVVARESGKILLAVSVGQLYSMWFSESEQNIVALFSLARKIAPCIIFIDEADAIFGR